MPTVSQWDNNYKALRKDSCLGLEMMRELWCYHCNNKFKNNPVSCMAVDGFVWWRFFQKANLLFLSLKFHKYFLVFILGFTITKNLFVVFLDFRTIFLSKSNKQIVPETSCCL